MINQDHLDMLASSGITEEFTKARGYETILDRTRLTELKIAKDGRNTPGLLVPMLRIDGSTWGYQYRPDNPRLRNGKIVKYETPWQQRNGLDIPPGVGPILADPAVPLWITEGCKKADCGATQGLCIVALSGVWNWLTTNSAGGKMALPEWRDIAVNGRRVIIGFDGDTARNENVQKAARALAGYLATKGARIEYLHLPDADAKVGLDDYLTGGHTVEDLWRLVKPIQPTPTPADGLSSPPNHNATAQPRTSTVMPEVARLPRILDKVAEEVRSRGLVGEERLAQTLYLVFTSRLLDKQVSAGVKGHSAVGQVVHRRDRDPVLSVRVLP